MVVVEIIRWIRWDEVILYFWVNIFVILSYVMWCFGVCVIEEKSYYVYLICWMFGVLEYLIELNWKLMKRED